MSNLKKRLTKLEKSRAAGGGPGFLAVVCRDENGNYRMMDGESIAAEDVAELGACIVVNFVGVRETHT